MLESFGYTGPEHVLAIFKRYVSPAGKVLDSAAGTSLIGQVLYEEGYHDLVALDMSESMLRVAKQKKVYRDLIRGVLGEQLPLLSDTFDAVVTIGLFTIGHAPASSLYELVRITKPGGLLIFLLYIALLDEFKQIFYDLTSAGQWRLREVSNHIFFMPDGEPEAAVQLWIYEVI